MKLAERRLSQLYSRDALVAGLYSDALQSANFVVTTAIDFRVYLKSPSHPPLNRSHGKFAVRPLTFPDAIAIVTFASADDGAVSRVSRVVKGVHKVASATGNGRVGP